MDDIDHADRCTVFVELDAGDAVGANQKPNFLGAGTSKLGVSMECYIVRYRSFDWRGAVVVYVQEG
ncbi:hypothetical protein Alches_12760 [Alicyclobacillus hesperidum subsp. aegles]|uniref:Uncharacterized protein n=1 Tax=Alicyclobacillus hesperidum TaxID=89784 RepID=A0AA37U6Z2_9BACL|nr:hypothetical protein Alches_12760 [Alicyclobacillus hesperidum subsp. aegles]GLV14689.1 hypothetical protein Heshes_23730 [Alicyclobacillus hesperidum]GMA64123.1 hypothetical protein GCM10025859_45630 [Alicyclobacillus fastidiosus]